MELDSVNWRGSQPPGKWKWLVHNRVQLALCRFCESKEHWVIDTTTQRRSAITKTSYGSVPSVRDGVESIGHNDELDACNKLAATLGVADLVDER